MNISSYKQIQFLLWHRNQYRGGLAKRLRGYFKRVPFLQKFRNITDIFELFRKAEIEELHAAEIEKTIQSFLEYAPSEVRCTLDIGAGLGGVDVAMYKTFGEPDVYLLDKHGVSSAKRGGFFESADDFSYYHSFIETKKFLLQNGVADNKIHCIDINTQKFPEENFDVVVSFLSWGFHFSIDTYLDQVYESLREGGILVMDIRNETDGIEKLHSKFQQEPKVVASSKNYKRIVVTK